MKCNPIILCFLYEVTVSNSVFRGQHHRLSAGSTCLEQSRTDISSRENICHHNLQKKTELPVLVRHFKINFVYTNLLSLQIICVLNMTTYSSTQIWVGFFVESRNIFTFVKQDYKLELLSQIFARIFSLLREIVCKLQYT